jgi:acyl-CoA thioester hydrolase
MEKKIYYHDTDAGGVIYYANYLKYFEEARTELLKEKGVDISRLAKQGILFAVRKVEIDYKVPGCYGDNLIVSARIERVKSASLEFIQSIDRAGEVLVTAKIQLVCISSDFKPRAFPEEASRCLKEE